MAGPTSNLYDRMFGMSPPTPVGMVPAMSNPAMRLFQKDAYRALLLAKQAKQSAALNVRRMQMLLEGAHNDRLLAKSKADRLAQELLLLRLRVMDEAGRRFCFLGRGECGRQDHELSAALQLLG